MPAHAAAFSCALILTGADAGQARRRRRTSAASATTEATMPGLFSRQGRCLTAPVYNAATYRRRRRRRRVISARHASLNTAGGADISSPPEPPTRD